MIFQRSCPFVILGLTAKTIYIFRIGYHDTTSGSYFACLVVTVISRSHAAAIDPVGAVPQRTVQKANRRKQMSIIFLLFIHIGIGNLLANSLKPVVLPGEKMKIVVIKEGKDPGQGIGYLDDGTMVVVDSGKKYVGDEIFVTVTSVLQTPAGRMIFAKYAHG